MTGQFAYFEKDGKVVKAPLVKWAKYRRSGYTFSTVEAFNAQEHGTAADASTDDDTVELPTMDNTKAEILAFARDQGVTVDPEDTKAALIETLDDALG